MVVHSEPQSVGLSTHVVLSRETIDLTFWRSRGQARFLQDVDTRLMLDRLSRCFVYELSMAATNHVQLHATQWHGLVGEKAKLGIGKPKTRQYRQGVPLPISAHLMLW